ncbi:hypothetical protein NPIL_45321 [Nephila pilipes]|uniref:Uncharacterized protein n=1 Tax=Nephila pilipes TaxID=299642 RepID=A0A8X6P2J5_NEPPI|nr:hypothetical protein NPIL_45321 [Nephila pilipes]
MVTVYKKWCTRRSRTQPNGAISGRSLEGRKHNVDEETKATSESFLLRNTSFWKYSRFKCPSLWSSASPRAGGSTSGPRAPRSEVRGEKRARKTYYRVRSSRDDE